MNTAPKHASTSSSSSASNPRFFHSRTSQMTGASTSSNISSQSSSPVASQQLAASSGPHATSDHITTTSARSRTSSVKISTECSGAVFATSDNIQANNMAGVGSPALPPPPPPPAPPIQLPELSIIDQKENMSRHFGPGGYYMTDEMPAAAAPQIQSHSVYEARAQSSATERFARAAADAFSMPANALRRQAQTVGASAAMKRGIKHLNVRARKLVANGIAAGSSAPTTAKHALKSMPKRLLSIGNVALNPFDVRAQGQRAHSQRFLTGRVSSKRKRSASAMAISKSKISQDEIAAADAAAWEEWRSRERVGQLYISVVELLRGDEGVQLGPASQPTSPKSTISARPTGSFIEVEETRSPASHSSVSSHGFNDAASSSSSAYAHAFPPSGSALKCIVLVERDHACTKTMTSVKSHVTWNAHFTFDVTDDRFAMISFEVFAEGMLSATSAASSASALLSPRDERFVGFAHVPIAQLVSSDEPVFDDYLPLTSELGEDIGLLLHVTLQYRSLKSEHEQYHPGVQDSDRLLIEKMPLDIGSTSTRHWLRKDHDDLPRSFRRNHSKLKGSKANARLLAQLTSDTLDDLTAEEAALQAWGSGDSGSIIVFSGDEEGGDESDEEYDSEADESETDQSDEDMGNTILRSHSVFDKHPKTNSAVREFVRDELRSVAGDLKSRIAAVETSIRLATDELQRDRDDAKRRHNKNKGRIKEQGSKLESLSQRVAQLSTHLHAAGEENRSLKNQLIELEDDLAYSRARMDSLENALDDLLRRQHWAIVKWLYAILAYVFGFFGSLVVVMSVILKKLRIIRSDGAHVQSINAIKKTLEEQRDSLQRMAAGDGDGIRSPSSAQSEGGRPRFHHSRIRSTDSSDASAVSPFSAPTSLDTHYRQKDLLPKLAIHSRRQLTGNSHPDTSTRDTPSVSTPSVAQPQIVSLGDDTPRSSSQATGDSDAEFFSGDEGDVEPRQNTHLLPEEHQVEESMVPDARLVHISDEEAALSSDSDDVLAPSQSTSSSFSSSDGLQRSNLMPSRRHLRKDLAGQMVTKPLSPLMRRQAVNTTAPGDVTRKPPLYLQIRPVDSPRYDHNGEIFDDAQFAQSHNSLFAAGAGTSTQGKRPRHRRVPSSSDMIMARLERNNSRRLSDSSNSWSSGKLSSVSSPTGHAPVPAANVEAARKSSGQESGDTTVSTFE